MYQLFRVAEPSGVRNAAPMLVRFVSHRGNHRPQPNSQCRWESG